MGHPRLPAQRDGGEAGFGPGGKDYRFTQAMIDEFTNGCAQAAAGQPVEQPESIDEAPAPEDKRRFEAKYGA